MTHQLYWIIISLFTYQFYNLCVLCLKTYYSCVALACALRDTFWFITFFMCLGAMCLVSISNSNSRERKKHWHHCICVSLFVSFQGKKKKMQPKAHRSLSISPKDTFSSISTLHFSEWMLVLEMKISEARSVDSSQRVWVAVSVRPLITSEFLLGCTDCILVVQPQVLDFLKISFNRIWTF